MIDTDVKDSIHFVDENMIMSSDSELDLPKKKDPPTKAADNPTSKAKSAPRKRKAVKEDGAKKAVGKTTAMKRKATEEQVKGEEQPATKKGFTATAAQSGDELEELTGEEPRQEANAKPKRKAKAKKPMVEHAGDDNHKATVVQQTQIQNGVKTSKTTQPAITYVAESTLGELDSSAEASTICRTQHPVKKGGRSTSCSRQENNFRRRAGSASDTERGGGDPNLRRKLGDVTRKFENIDLKYRNLKDVGILEANANMDKLRRQCESTTSASTELIASLKRELATQMPLAQETRQLQLDLQNSNKEATQYRTTVSNLESSLAAAQNEIKALQAKLAAARSSATSVESVSAKTPASAMKNCSQARTIMVGTAEAAQAAQTAQLKEDLYSDLTGLIIRGVKRTEAGDAYDCIQTGRNGSKSPPYHFTSICC